MPFIDIGNSPETMTKYRVDERNRVLRLSSNAEDDNTDHDYSNNQMELGFGIGMARLAYNAIPKFSQVYNSAGTGDINLEPHVKYDFSDSTDAPGLGDTLSIKQQIWTTDTTIGGSSPQSSLLNQWMMRFEDTNGNILGGIIQTTNEKENIGNRTGLRLRVFGDGGPVDVEIGSAPDGLFPNLRSVARIYDCTTTASEITITVRRNDIYGVAVAVATATVPNLVNGFGPPVRWGFGRLGQGYWTTSSTYRNRDLGRYHGMIVAVNEDLADYYIYNQYVPDLISGQPNPADATIATYAHGTVTHTTTVTVHDDVAAGKRAYMQLNRDTGAPVVEPTYEFVGIKMAVVSRADDQTPSNLKFTYGLRYGSVNYTLSESPAIKTWKDEFYVHMNPANSLPFASISDIVLFAGSVEVI